MSIEAMRVAPRPARRDWAGQVADSFRAQWIFFVVPLLYLATNELFMRGLAHPLRAPFAKLISSMATLSLPAALFALFIARLVQLAVTRHEGSAARAIVNDIWTFVRSPQRLVHGLPVLVAMILFNKAMLELKPAIPEIILFAWDERLAALDRALHGGIDPWVLLQPLMGFAPVTFAVNLAYDFWFLALFGLWFWFAFRPEPSVLRTRFFLAYMLAWWVGGGLLALAFSSAGPCYYGAIGLNPDPFAPLMAYLHEANARLPIWALDAQNLLWRGYQGQLSPFLGISAFPSMHNAMAVIFALAGFRLDRRLGLFFSAYAGLILLGSVHLGWHYAVDGYAGILLALGAWRAAGPLARWVHGLEAHRQQARPMNA